MRLARFLSVGLLTMTAAPAWAGDKLEAAVGGAAGGAAGAVIGDEIGDRKGAIIGAAVGAAVGTAIATDGNSAGENHDRHGDGYVHIDAGAHRNGYHCPPGQAKKGRC